MKNDLQIVNINNDLITEEQLNGFHIEKSKLMMVVKNIPSNIYKLAVLLVAAISEFIPGVIEKVPGIGYAIDMIGTFGKTYASSLAYDTIFDKIICPLLNLEYRTPQYHEMYWEFTNTSGKYYGISLVIKSLAVFAMEHPGLVLAGAAGIAGFIVSKVSKRIVKSVKYDTLTESQQELYLLVKDILKKTRKFKNTENAKILINDLNITYKIIENIEEHPDIQKTLKIILTNLRDAINKKDISNYEIYRLALESSVHEFNKDNDHILTKKIHLVVGNNK